MEWCRLYHDMVTDPKWRVVARRAGRPLTEVVAVWTLMLTTASQATPRGEIVGWVDEDAAAALDMDPDDVGAIRDAMQGKVLDDERLTGWERRQPKRERDDSSAERVKAHRERQKAQRNTTETPRNATERPETPRGDKSREESSVPDGTGASAPVDHPQDLKSRIFGPALTWLSEHSDKPPHKLRTLMGRWCRDYGDGAVLEALQQAARAGPVDPVPWITDRLTKGKNNGKRPDAGERIARDAEDIDSYFGVERDGAAAGDDEPEFDLEGDYLRVA